MMLSALKKRLPSRNTCILLGALSTLVGIKQYDRYEGKKRLEEIKLQLKPLADRPMAVTELADKYIVFLHSPEETNEAVYKATEYFINYVKPVWDAAAVDYEVVTEKDGGEIQKYAYNQIKRLRSGSKPSNPEATAPTIDQLEPESKIIGWVALGHEAYGKLLKGIQDGASVSDLSFTPEEAPSSKLESLIPEQYRQEELHVPTATPPLGYIQFHHYYGYRYIPLRFYKWLTSRNTVQKVGTDAMEILRSPPLPFKLPEDYIAKGMLDFRIGDFDASALNQLSPSLSDKLYLLAKK